MEDGICTWYKKFDGHYTLDCTNETGHRANCNFHKYIHNKNAPETKWNFVYCPYCGGKIIIHDMESES